MSAWRLRSKGDVFIGIIIRMILATWRRLRNRCCGLWGWSRRSLIEWCWLALSGLSRSWRRLGGTPGLIAALVLIVGSVGVSGLDEGEGLEVDNQLGAVLALLGLPGLCLESTFDQDGFPFGEMLGDGLSGFAPGCGVDKGGIVALFTGLCGKLPIDGYADIADLGSVGSDSELRVTGEISGEDDFIE